MQAPDLELRMEWDGREENIVNQGIDGIVTMLDMAMAAPIIRELQFTSRAVRSDRHVLRLGKEAAIGFQLRLM